MSEMDDLLVDDFYEEFDYTPEFDAAMKEALREYRQTFIMLRQAELAEREIH